MNAQEQRQNPVLRSKESIHKCQDPSLDHDEGSSACADSFPSDSFETRSSAGSCHSHDLIYISTATPSLPDTFSNLRRSVIRTLSGEQLPRGHTSGPLWFGDPTSGYTIAYKFRIADPSARGRQRYYALLALVGSDTKRAFDASVFIWSFFERIATKILASAKSAASKVVWPREGSGDQRQYTPVSSFLTGRTMDPDGFPRRGGSSSIKANSLSDLVADPNFFLELHKDLVMILQDLGRLFGGVKLEIPVTGIDAVNPCESNRMNPESSGGQGPYQEPPASISDSGIRVVQDVAAGQSEIQMPLWSTPALPHRQSVAV